jgi:predicted small metal-binding protein
MKVACKAVGGPADCPVVVEGEDLDELVDKLQQHGEEAHPELAKKMMEMDENQRGMWMTQVKQAVTP